MLVMRIEGMLDKKKGCHIDGYETGGWFVIESFNFGFNPKKGQEADPRMANNNSNNNSSSDSDGDNKKSKALRKKDNKKKRPPPPPDREDFSSMQISKQVDSTSVYLMKKVMDWKSNTPDAVKPNAEIHIVGSMRIEEKTVYTQSKIHLQEVSFKEWSVGASGNGRPEEQLKLQYVRAALWYQGSEGTGLDYAFEDGWDGANNARWAYFNDARRALDDSAVY